MDQYSIMLLGNIFNGKGVFIVSAICVILLAIALLLLLQTIAEEMRYKRDMNKRMREWEEQNRKQRK